MGAERTERGKGGAPDPDATRDLSNVTDGSTEVNLVVVDADTCVRVAVPAHGEVIVGRGRDATLRIQQPWISRHHIRLRVGESIELEDLGGTNGTRVRGELMPSRGRAILQPGDVIEIGATMIVVSRGARSGNNPVTRAELEEHLAEESARAQRAGLVVDIVAVLPAEEANGAVPLAMTSAPAAVHVRVRGGAIIAVATRAASGEPLAERVRDHLRSSNARARVGATSFVGRAPRAVSPGALVEEALRAAAVATVDGQREELPLKDLVSALEKTRIEDALRQCNDNQSQAAKRLGIGRNTLLRRMKAFGIPCAKRGVS